MSPADLADAVADFPLVWFPSRRSAQLAAALVRELRKPTPDDPPPPPRIGRPPVSYPKNHKAKSVFKPVTP